MPHSGAEEVVNVQGMARVSPLPFRKGRAGRTTQMGEADSEEVVDRYDCEYTRNVVVD